MLGAEKPVPRVAPVYDAASIVNAADNQSGALAANTLGTIYGANLAYSTAAITLSNIQGGVLPIVLGSSETAGVRQQLSRRPVLCFAHADQLPGSTES